MNDDVKKIKVCDGNACCMNFSDDIYKEAVKKCKSRKDIEVGRIGCQARCMQAPVVVVDKDEKREVFTEVDKRDLNEICGE